MMREEFFDAAGKLTGRSPDSVATVYREMIQAGLIKASRGRGRSATPMTVTDAARMTIALMVPRYIPHKNGHWSRYDVVRHFGRLPLSSKEGPPRRFGEAGNFEAALSALFSNHVIPCNQCQGVFIDFTKGEAGIGLAGHGTNTVWSLFRDKNRWQPAGDLGVRSSIPGSSAYWARMATLFGGEAPTK